MSHPSTAMPGAAEVYLERYGEATMRHIDALVKELSREPLNSEEVVKRKASTVGSTGLPMDKIRDIVSARHKAGMYDDVIAEIPKGFGGTSIRPNLRNIGIAK